MWWLIGILFVGVGVALGGKAKAARLASGPTFAPGVEHWRKLVTQQAVAAGIPPAFAMQWIKVESGGNPCAVGIPGDVDSFGNVKESGIWQLNGDGEIPAAGTTTAKMRPCCGPISGNRQETEFCSRQLTAAEEYEQVRAGIQYISRNRGLVRAQLASVGTTWDESSPDFWKAVKLPHGSGVVFGLAFQRATKNLGHPPAGFAELRKGWGPESAFATKVFRNAEETGGVL